MEEFIVSKKKKKKTYKLLKAILFILVTKKEKAVLKLLKIKMQKNEKQPLFKRFF